MLKGWEGIGANSGKFVPVEDGFSYVAQAVGIVELDPDAPEAGEFKDELVEWYFSGNWIEIEENEEEF